MSQGLETSARRSRLGAWMGVAFVVLLVVGFMVFSTPTNNKDTAKWQRWWTDSGHRTAAIIGAYLMVLAALAFVGFIWSLRRRLPDSGGLMVTFGSLFAGVVLVSTMVRATIPGSKQFGSTPLPAGASAADLARQFDQIGFGLLLVAGALAAGAFTAVASYSARQHAILPGWLTMAGYVVAVLQLAAAFFFPFLVFVLWVLVVSIVLLRHEPRVDTRVP
jgi:hypothetical protein